MEIRKYQPSLPLQNYIDAYWSIKNNTSKTISLPIVPDGCMDIIYNNTQLLFVGAMNESLIVDMPVGDYSFGIRFKPSILPQLFKIKADRYLNKIVPLREVSPYFYVQLNFYEANESRKVLTLNEQFEANFLGFIPNESMQTMVKRVMFNQGNVALSDLMNDTNLSNRHIERMFKHFIGYTPKKFCNIVRFFSIFKDIIKNNVSNFSLKAHELGYCDQSHFNKEFKKFSHFSPTDEIMSIFYKTKM